MQTEVRLDLLDHLLMLARWKKFLVLHTLAWTVAVGVASFFLPCTYTAHAVLMPPKGGSDQVARMVRSLPVAKLAGLGSLAQMGSQGENGENLYRAILSSRTLQMQVVDTFDLAHVYKFARARKYYVEDVLKELQKHIGVEVEDEGTFVISAEDRLPGRAADIVNFMAAKLDEIYKGLATETERNQRIFLAGRMQLIKADLDSAERAYTRFQKSNRLVDIEEQAKASIDVGSEMEARYLAAEIKLEMAKKVFAGDNPRVVQQEVELEALRDKREDLSSTRQSDLLIPYRQTPEMGLQMVRLRRNLKIQETLYELMVQEYEHAKFEESKNVPTVQVLDRALPPQKRTFPKRGRLVLAAFFLSALGGVLLAASTESLRRYRVSHPHEYAKIRLLGRRLLSGASA